MNRQHARIEDYIRTNGSITGKDASEFLGIQSFTKRISEMKSKGYQLSSIWERGENRYGEPVRYKRWFING